MIMIEMLGLLAFIFLGIVSIIDRLALKDLKERIDNLEKTTKMTPQEMGEYLAQYYQGMKEGFKDAMEKSENQTCISKESKS